MACAATPIPTRSKRRQASGSVSSRLRDRARASEPALARLENRRADYWCRTLSQITSCFVSRSSRTATSPHGWYFGCVALRRPGDGPNAPSSRGSEPDRLSPAFGRQSRGRGQSTSAVATRNRSAGSSWPSLIVSLRIATSLFSGASWIGSVSRAGRTHRSGVGSSTTRFLRDSMSTSHTLIGDNQSSCFSSSSVRLTRLERRDGSSALHSQICVSSRSLTAGLPSRRPHRPAPRRLRGCGPYR